MASEFYNRNIEHIQTYFGISETCAKYIYHRALRGRRSDEKHLPWTAKLQNALVIADKCLGVNWDRIRFGSEENDLLVHGIVINDMEDKVFRWVPEDVNKSNTVDPGWTTVKSKSSVKRARQKNKPAFTKIGIFA